MIASLPTPAILRRYIDASVEPPLPALEVAWDAEVGERIWELPEGVCVVGPAPRVVGIKVERGPRDGLSVRLRWDRNFFAWDGLTRVQVLTSSLAPLLRALGHDLDRLLGPPAFPSRGRAA